MAWLTLSRTDSILLRQVRDEIDAGSHRATAVVGGAFVEDYLTDVLKTRMVKNEKITHEIFAPGQALGDFGVKISLGNLMGIYSDQARKELDTIRYIRNRFAHRLEVNDFEQQGIRDRCNNLVIWQSIKIKARRGEGKRQIVLTLGASIDEEEQELPLVDFVLDELPANSREKFITACRFYIAAFAILTNVEHQLPAPLF